MSLGRTKKINLSRKTLLCNDLPPGYHPLGSIDEQFSSKGMNERESRIPLFSSSRMVNATSAMGKILVLAYERETVNPCSTANEYR
jgi:hypothetical protein